VSARGTVALGVLAAGMGSRYGGLKQIDPVHADYILPEYSIFDAVRAGFSKIAILIRRDFERRFMKDYGERIQKGAGNMGAEVVFAFQEGLEEMPRFREKMWGTGNAALMLGAVISEPFAVINADDYYGRDSYRVLRDFFARPGYDPAGNVHALAGFRLRNVLSPHGGVARGICRVSDGGFVEDIDELQEIYPNGGSSVVCRSGAAAHHLDPDACTSMNFWGFNPTIFPALERGFREFTADVERRREPRKEFYLSSFAGTLAKSGVIKIKVLPTDARWFGMTYAKDRADVAARIRRYTERGRYPERLWGE